LILEGDLTSALKWHKKLFALSRNLLGLATNPIPIKAAMAILNMAPAEMRLPMTPLPEVEKTTLQKALKDYGLLN
ncbi:MAG: dihydrodipicolinate synthase family protein, partial [Planctomycetota bacterium]|jgi:4-hydroxy-tetrahydrodipicolinate synthase